MSELNQSFQPAVGCGTTRRGFLGAMGQWGGGLAGVALASMLGDEARAASPKIDLGPHFAPRAKSVIWLFMRGGVSHMESFDPKPIGVFKMSLAQEEAVSKAINELYELAQKERDYPSLQFLDWFLREQVEEEDSVTEVIDRLELVGDDPAGLLQIDAEAAARSPEEGGSGAAAG